MKDRLKTMLYRSAWNNLLIVLRNNYPLDIWLAPIDIADKWAMFQRGKKYLEKEATLKKSPLLFSEEKDE